MEAPRGVERTGTNGRTHERPSPGSGRPPLGAPAGGSHRGSRAIEEPSEARARSRPCPVPEPREPPPAQAAGRIKQHSLAAAMARGRRPVPFRTWKLRPGTAMVLHPAGCGRVARRRTNTCTGGPGDRQHANPQDPLPLHPHKTNLPRRRRHTNRQRSLAYQIPDRSEEPSKCAVQALFGA